MNKKQILTASCKGCNDLKAEIERLEKRVVALLEERDAYDARRREAMVSNEKWREKCWGLEKNISLELTN